MQYLLLIFAEEIKLVIISNKEHKYKEKKQAHYPDSRGKIELEIIEGDK